MDTRTYTHRDLAGLLGVSETTVKSYRSKFPGFLPVAREGKPVRLHAEALDVCRRIRDLFAEGLTILQATQRLRIEFREYPHNRRLSTSLAQGPGDGAQAGLAARLEALTEAQELARTRMEQLEAEVRNLATLEAASKSLVAELLQELRAARAAQPTGRQEVQPPAAPAPQAPAGPSVVTARKIVTVHGQGGAASYTLDREPGPEPLFTQPALPSADFLDLPVAIRSDRGEFLGLPGGQSVARLVEILRNPDGAPPAWFEEGPQAWACELVQGPALVRELLFERTTTPRGNLVGLIRRVRSRSGESVAEAGQAEVQELFRQVRDRLG